LAAIVLAIIFRREEGISLVFIPFVFLFAIGGLMIGLISEKGFDKEKFTTLDKVVNVFEVEDVDGKKILCFPSFNEDLIKLDNFKFDEVIRSGDRMQVRLIKRETPRGYWNFSSSSKKIILTIPENTKR
jgi:hypothetical protein